MQNIIDKVVIDKDEEISRLRDHNQNLLIQVKTTKDTTQRNQKLEEENCNIPNTDILLILCIMLTHTLNLVQKYEIIMHAKIP